MDTRTITVRAIIPGFRYEDAPRAIEFLCDAFGFEKHVVYEGAEGRIDHAQLRLGDHFIMLGSGDARDKTPRELGGATGSHYVVLERDEDVDAHCERARAAGAVITMEPYSPDYGGRGYGAEDLEGYHWSFGSYRPESA